MLRLIQGADRSLFPKEIEAMHRLRAAVFAERLGWDVVVVEGLERDRFDECNPLYLVSLAADGAVRGSLRLLPTTGPNMLRDVFSCLLPEGVTVESPVVWESTRFSVDLGAVTERSNNRLNYATGELLAGIVEVGMLAGLTHVVSVYDARMARVLKSAGCPADLLGPPQRIGDVLTFAGLFEISDDMLDRIRWASGISDTVLETKSVLLAFAA